MANSADPDQLASSEVLQKPTDLDLHCLLGQGMSCSAREGLKRGTNYFVFIYQIIAIFSCVSCRERYI